MTQKGKVAKSFAFNNYRHINTLSSFILSDKNANFQDQVLHMYLMIATVYNIHTSDKNSEASSRNLSLGGGSSSWSSSLRVLLGAILLEWAHELGLVGRRLEATMTEFGRGVDELQFDLLQSNTLGAGDKSLEKKTQISLKRPIKLKLMW